jgi:MjaI restriction endonuclease
MTEGYKYSTGGILNTINEKYKCNQTHKSVPVIKLYKAHSVKTLEQAEFFISSHQAGHEHGNCSCGIRSQGTVEMFGDNLYEAVKKYELEFGQNVNKTLEDCRNFMYGLFVVKSLTGFAMEELALKLLNVTDTLYDVVVRATDEEDLKMGVDLKLQKEVNVLAGIQVKPESYKFASIDVKNINAKKESLFEKPVIYLYYNSTKEFTNFDEVVNQLNSFSIFEKIMNS